MHAFCEAEKSITASSIPITLVIILEFPLSRVIFLLVENYKPKGEVASKKRSLGKI